MQVWTNSGIPDGGKSYCDNFAFGDKDKCVVSYGTVLIAALIFLIWVLALAIAVYLLLFYRRNGYLPNSRPSISNPSLIEPKLSIETSDAIESRSTSKPELKPDQHRDLEPGFTHTDTPHGTHPGKEQNHPALFLTTLIDFYCKGRKMSTGVSPPLTAPSRFDVEGSRPHFRTVSYRRGGANENTPLSASQQEPDAPSGAPRLQIWDPEHAPVHQSATANYGTLANSGPVTADVRRLPPYSPSPTVVRSGANYSFTFEANRRPSIRNTPSLLAAGYSSARYTPLPTAPLARPASPWARS